MHPAFWVQRFSPNYSISILHPRPTPFLKVDWSLTLLNLLMFNLIVLQGNVSKCCITFCLHAICVCLSFLRRLSIGCSAAYSQSKALIALVGFHLYSLPTPIIYILQQNIFLPSHDFPEPFEVALNSCSPVSLFYAYIVHSKTVEHDISIILLRYTEHAFLHNRILLWSARKWTSFDPNAMTDSPSPEKRTLLSQLIRFHTFSKVITFSPSSPNPSVFTTLTLITD